MNDKSSSMRPGIWDTYNRSGIDFKLCIGFRAVKLISTWTSLS